MQENEFQDLTSLMKVRFGVTKSSPLRLTEKDTLFTAFRKIADNIYKNGEWTVEDEIQAVDTMMRNRNDVAVGTNRISYYAGRENGYLPMTIDVAPITDIERSRLGSRADNFSGYTATVTKQLPDGSSEEKKTFVLLDPENKKGTVHNQHYYFGGYDAYKDGTDLTDTVFYAEGNKNRAIGYDRLQKDILKEFDKQAVDSEVDGISRGNMEYYLRRLVNPKNSGKKNEKIFKKKSHGELTDEFLATLPREENTRFWSVPPTEKEIEDGREPFNYRDLTEYPDSPNKLNLDKAPYILSNSKNSRTFISPEAIPAARRHNKMVDFVQNYIESTYDIILQREYEKDIEKQTRASAWQTKKNINKETQTLMETTSLKDHFGFVELDNDVELELFGQFEVEMKKIHELLPKTEVKADLRLRKLGNYRALGLYNSLTRTIAIDFRDYSDDINGIGIRSFIHEYGHFLDYSVGKGLLSMQENFRPFVARYRKKIESLPEKSYVRLKSHYYGAPTEVFARSFEMYAAECGLKSNLLQSKEAYRVLEEYSIMDDSMRMEIFEYFDQTFPEFKSKIREFNGLPALEEQLADVVEETAPTIQKDTTQEKISLEQLDNFSGNELDYLEKTVAVFLHTVMLTDPQYESDMVFVGYEEQANAGEQLSIEEKRHVDSWVTTNVSHDKEQLSEIRVAIDATKSAKKVEQNKESELNLSEEELIQTVESAAAEHDFKEEETVMLQEAGQKITALKNLQLYLDGERIPLEKALDHCDLSLLTKTEAIEHQKSEIEKYSERTPRSESLDRITRMYEEQLTEFETLTPDTIFLFDGSDNASHSINPRNIVSDIVELSVFQEAYGEAIYDFSDVTSNFGLYADQTELANQTNQEFIEEGGEYIPIQTTEQMNKLLDGENAVALPETALPFIEEYAKHVPITYDWTFDEIGHEYAEYKANGKAFHMERAEMDITIDDVRPELVDRLMDGDIVLSAVYDEAVLQQLSPEAQHYWKSALSLTEELEETEGEASGKQEKLFDALINTYPKAVVQDMKEKSTGDSKENQLQEKKIAEESSDLDMSRLGQARRKLERLETELAGKFDQMYEHQRLTNGQPMNDKRNGRAWFNKQEKIDDSIRNLMQQIEEQKDRVEKYERHAEYKEMGMNKQGGLIMSIENIPRIKEEIEKSKVGESLFSRDTIRKYEKQLEILEAAKNQAEVAENNLSSHAKALIESGNLNQWKKNPMIYFVKDLKKVAFELTPEGDFQLAAKYQPVTADEKARVVELLSGKEEAKEGANMAYNEKQNTTEVDQQREDLSDLQSLEDSLSGSTKESSVMVDQEKSEALEVLEDSFKELADGEFYREMLKKYDLTNLGDIRKAQGEVDQQLQAHFEEQKNAAEIEKEMLNAYEEKEDERIQLQENFGIAEATNETPDRYFQVEFNEMNPRLGINRYQGEVVTSELIFEWQSFESAASSNVGHSKFFINEMINGEFITQHRLNVGEGLNNSMYDFLMQGAVSKKRAAEITNGRVVAGGRQQQSPTKEENEIEPGLNDLPTNSQEDQQLKNSNLHVLANSFNIEDGVRSYQEELVSPELLAELKILDNDCEAKGKTYEFLFGREVEGREEFVQLFVGEGLDENEHLYNQLEEMLSVSKQAEIADSSEQPATQMDYDGEVNQAVNEVLDVMAQKEEGTNEYLTRAEFDQALNNHFTRIEQLLSNRAAAVDSIEQPVLEQKPAFVKGLMENVKSEVARFKEDLLSKLSAFKEDPMYYVRDKVDSLRVRVKNTINSKRIERANKQIEKLVDKIENKYALEEKGERLESNRKGTEEVVKEVAEQTAEPIKRINEEQPEPVRTVEKEEPPIEVIEQSEDDPIKQIENLSNRLGLSITEKEKKKISQLTDKEKENLIQEMNEALPKEKEQEEVAAEEPEIEIA